MRIASAPSRSIVAGALAVLTLLAGSAWAIPLFAPDQPGELKVGHTQSTVVDTSREDRPLPLEIWHPADPTAWEEAAELSFYSLLGSIGMDSAASKDDLAFPEGSRYPLIVFSHGYGSLSLQSLRLMEHLASHGFVVVAPTHTGNSQGDESPSPNPEADRYPDVAFVIDQMAVADLNSESPFYGHVDTSNSGVAGHSYGGMTSMFMAAGYGELPPDSRVKAIMPIAASSGALSDSQIAGIRVPTLLLVGTLDGLWPETVRSSRLIQSADLFRVDVVDANHTHFANVCDIGQVLLDNGLVIAAWPLVGAGALVPIWDSTCVPPAFPIEEATRLQNLFATAHFRTYLAGESSYASYLTPEYAAAEPDILFFVPEPHAPLMAWAALGVVGWLQRRRSRLRDMFEETHHRKW